ncbi:MAG: hypothetical protein SFY32_16760 [Bacteroidota bacterium]|nr:hypothetical protein [Bacteroidota bacterium]
MSKFSISQLEVARQNPKQFANNLKAAAGTKPSFFGRGKFVRWQDAVSEYHKQNDLSKAINYLEKSFSNRTDNAKNRNEVTQFISSLDAYVAEFKKKGFSVMDFRKRIQIDLNSKVFISGQIPVTYMNTKGGFSVYFFSQDGLGWEAELKFPILQKYFAEEIYGTNLENIEVGIFSTASDNFFQQIFTEDEVKAADKELKKIGRIIYDIL